MEYKSYAVKVQTEEEEATEVLEYIKKNIDPSIRIQKFSATPYYIRIQDNTWGYDGGDGSAYKISGGGMYNIEHIFEEMKEWRQYISGVPESWFIRVTSENKPILQRYVFFGTKRGYNYTLGGYYGINKNGSAWGDIVPHGDAQEITIEQFEKHMSQQNKKIIGYKAPTDLFAGEVKKGELLVKNGHYYDKHGSYRKKDYNPNDYNVFPKEIVETWEPVYEEEKTVQIGTPKFDVFIKGDTIEVPKYAVVTNKQAIKTWLSGFIAERKVSSVFGNNPFSVKDMNVHIGCSEGPDVTLEELQSLIK